MINPQKTSFIEDNIEMYVWNIYNIRFFLFFNSKNTVIYSARLRNLRFWLCLCAYSWVFLSFYLKCLCCDIIINIGFIWTKTSLPCSIVQIISIQGVCFTDLNHFLQGCWKTAWRLMLTVSWSKMFRDGSPCFSSFPKKKSFSVCKMLLNHIFQKDLCITK